MIDAPGPPALPTGLLAGGRFDDWRPTVPRYIVCDIDGTLLAGRPLPSERTLAAVRRLVASGARVGLATGRMAGAVGPLLASGAFTGPHVFHNGALVLGGDGEEILAHPLLPQDVAALLAFGADRDDLTIEIYLDHGYLVNRVDRRADGHVGLLGVAPMGTIRSVEEISDRTAVKAVVVAFDPQASAEAHEAVAALGLGSGPASSPATPGLHYLNVTRPEVDKGTGLRAAAASLGLDVSETAAIGDDRNDVPMLTLAGTAVAMGGAHPAATASAHLVAPDLADDGVATALEALLSLRLGTS